MARCSAPDTRQNKAEISVPLYPLLTACRETRLHITQQPGFWHIRRRKCGKSRDGAGRSTSMLPAFSGSWQQTYPFVTHQEKAKLLSTCCHHRISVVRPFGAENPSQKISSFDRFSNQVFANQKRQNHMGQAYLSCVRTLRLSYRIYPEAT